MKEKGRFLKKYRGNACLNCGVPLDVIDRYCHHCGQINTTKKLSLKDFFDEFFASILSYDSRLRHTIVALLFNPGKISKEYVEGKRVKYANPFRFYLSVSIIFFIINGLFIDFDHLNVTVEDDVTKGKKAIAEIEKNIVIDDSLKQEITNQISTTKGISETDAKKINDKIASFENLSLFGKKINVPKEVIYYSQHQIDSLGFFGSPFKLWSMYNDHYEKTGEKSAFRALKTLDHDQSRFNKYVYHRAIKTNTIGDSFGRELVEFIFSKLPFIIFFFLPFFALAIWLLYIRKPFSYMEHLVFTFHTQTMFFILIGIAILIGQITKSGTISGIAMLIFIVYLYKAMRKFYTQGRAKTIVKFLLVNVLFFILAGVGTAFTIAGSIFIF